MLFVSFFWSFFHSSLSPAVDLGATWPPVGINAVNPCFTPGVMVVVDRPPPPSRELYAGKHFGHQQVILNDHTLLVDLAVSRLPCRPGDQPLG